MADIRVRLSVLWLFATLNYIYADVFFCIDVLGSNKGSIGVIHFSQVGWLGIAVLMEIPMAMIVLSLILKPGANRWANIVAGIIETAAVLLTSFIFHLPHHGDILLLYVLWSDRSGLYFADHLLCLEMAKSNRPPN